MESYLNFKKGTEELQDQIDESTAVADLAYMYITLNQHSKAKEFIFSLLRKYPVESLDKKKLSVLYNNLGQCFLNEQKPDSALHYYNKSLTIKYYLADSVGIANSKINLASLYNKNQNYEKALKLSSENIAYLKNKNKADLWYNIVNKAGALNGLKKTKEAKEAILEALNLAETLDSKVLIQGSHEQLANYYAENQLYQKAFEELIISNRLKSEIINEESNSKIAELQEYYNAEERERENELLNIKIDIQKKRQLLLIISLIALCALVGTVGFALLKNRKKNKLISAQNQKLSELNAEKNHLMSVVSHDLSSPFTAIKLWAENLTNGSKSDVEESKEMIIKTSEFGLDTIKNILIIDKNELQHVYISEMDIADLLKSLMQRFKALAENKNIKLKVDVQQDAEVIFTDKNLLFRALENILSNAIKYSKADKTVWLKTYEMNKFLYFEIKDEGIGIPEADIKTIFERYSITENKSTGGEKSTGLGLNIVKRISEELGAKISIESELGYGTTFTFSLPL
jgi:two-component system, OmpR family, phosphate regulon sensor histidine kinase PhoR